MSAIASDRPAFPPSAGGAAHTLRTAQSAFFRQALGAPAPVHETVEAQAVSAARAMTAEPTAGSRLQRPGSLLDIRV